MASIKKISININTASDSGAGTDGDVYIGFCGREFFCDTTADDFERGSSRTYVFGEGSTVLNASLNDPRSPNFRTVISTSTRWLSGSSEDRVVITGNCSEW